MKSIPRLLAVTATLFTAAAVAHAHPGHEHSDIPSLIRHPFAGPEHLLGSAAIGLAVAAALYGATRRIPMPALARWSGLSAVALIVAFVVPA